MAVVPVKINGREYQVACDDGQEEHLQFLSEEVNSRLKMLLRGMRSSPGEVMTLILTALMMADEIIENKREIESIAAEVQRLAALVNDDKRHEQDGRMAEIEHAMATTLEEIAMRIERIADRIELS